MNANHKNLRTFYAIVATQARSMLGSRLSGLAVSSTAVYALPDTATAFGA